MSKASEPQSVHFCGWERQQTANGACHGIVAGKATFAENATPTQAHFNPGRRVLVLDAH